MSLILTHGANSLANKPVLDGFLYLTYFKTPAPDDVSHSASYDVPIYGDTVLYLPIETNINRGLVHDWSSTQYGYPNYLGITDYTGLPCMPGIPGGSKYTEDTTLLSYINGSDTISLEGIFNVSNGGYWSGYNEWGSFGMSPPSGGYYWAGYNYYYSDRGIGIGVPGSMPLEYTSSSFFVGTFDGSACQFLLPNAIEWRRSTGVHHFAFVFNRSNNKTYCYFDGELAAIGSSIIQVGNLGFSNSSPYTGLEFTQFAIRAGDCSINNGQNYPVPTTPYVTSF